MLLATGACSYILELYLKIVSEDINGALELRYFKLPPVLLRAVCFQDQWWTTRIGRRQRFWRFGKAELGLFVLVGKNNFFLAISVLRWL